MKFSYTTLLLLVCSNCFMTYAWYGHLKKMANAPLWLAVLASWAIAFLEYWFMIPANRIGAAAGMTLDQLKITQEAISLLVFIPFSIFIMDTPVTWRYLAAMGCILTAVALVFWNR